MSGKVIVECDPSASTYGLLSNDDPIPSGRFGPEESCVGQGHRGVEVGGLLR